MDRTKHQWFGITVIDIGIGIIGFAWLFRRIAILERENGRLQAEVAALTKENRDLHLELEQERQTLKAEFEQQRQALIAEFDKKTGLLDKISMSWQGDTTKSKRCLHCFSSAKILLNKPALLQTASTVAKN